MGNRPDSLILFSLVVLATILVTPPVGATAQVPVGANARGLLQEDPEVVRQRLMQLGLSESEIRARLAAGGVPANSLDAVLSGASVASSAPLDDNALSALRVLGLAVETADGLELVEVTTGMQIGFPLDSIDVGFPIFGHDVFTRATSQFQPLLSGPVPDDYHVAPGDQFVLILTGEAQLAHELSVTREGFVVVPDVGRISVANLTMAELRVLLRRRLADSYSGIGRGTTTLDVTITRLRTNQIYVVGEVEQVGAYQLASVATVTNALYAAGGPTRLGSLRDVRVQRRDGADVRLDLYPYLLEGDISGDIVLEQGDLVFVPLKGRRVQVHGSVIRPAYYELAESDDLVNVLLAAGGLSPEANRERITIHRVLRPAERGPGLGNRGAIDLALRPSDDRTDPNHLGGVTIPPVGLQDGDSIVVGEVPSLSDGYYVTIAGMVAAADTFPWREGMTVRDVVLLARGPIVGADLREAHVSRLPDDRVAGELADLLRVPLDSSYLSQRSLEGRYVGPPGVAFSPPGSAPEFVLEPYDQVVISRQPEFQMPQTVVVTGEVSVPGEYTLLTKNDHVTSLIDRASGLLGTGYPEGARLYRAQDELGRIDLNLPNALSNPAGPNDLVLQPGDSLHIPVYSPTVVVRGAVNSPVTVLYQEGKDFGYYLANAGGYRNDADKGRVSVRAANGQARTRSKFLFWSSYPEPGPGSIVTVPAKDPADRLDTRGLIADLVGVLGSITTVIVVLAR